MQNNFSTAWVSTNQPCPSCSSSDAFAVNDQGWGRCFSCKANVKVNTIEPVAPAAPPQVPSASGLLTDLSYQAIAARGLTEDTCRKFSYATSYWHGEPVQVAQYHRAGGVVAQKLRNAAKRFTLLGDTKGLPLFGQQLWSGTGKMVVVTEGEIDALTVSQLQGNRWATVSLPGGASAARKDLANALEFLSGYDKVVLMFDQDSAGREATQVAAEVLPPGKAWVATLPLKDASACLMAGKGDAVVRAIWDATPWRPDAVLAGADMLGRVRAFKGPQGAVWPWQGMNTMLPVLPVPGITTIISGTGSGKSTMCRALSHHLISLGENLGLMHLEEDVTRSALGIVGYEMGQRLDLSVEGVDPVALEAAFTKTMREGVYLYDHFGSTDGDNLIGKIRYFAQSGRCRYVVLDHLSIVVSGMEITDERKAIDIFMTKLRTLAQELSIGIILVVHLRRRDGKPPENGGELSLSDIRGSQAVAQLSDVVLGGERDQQAEGEERNITLVRVLKNRVTGHTGPGCKLLYDNQSGRYTEVPLTYSAAVEKPDDFDLPTGGQPLPF